MVKKKSAFIRSIQESFKHSTVMRDHVCLQGTFRYGTVDAVVTSERFLPSVSAHVCLQVTLFGRAVGTV